jgi:peroxiredoxin
MGRLKPGAWMGVSLIALSLAVGADRGPAAAFAQDAGLKVDDFRLSTADLQSYGLYPMSDAAAVVIVTYAGGDPAVRAMAPALSALAQAYGPRGVEVLMLNSNPAETRQAVLAETAALDLTLPVLMDDTQLVGEQLGVTRAGEVIVIDPKTWVVAYRGPLSGDRGEPWAREAIEAVMDGATVAVAERPVRGGQIAFPGRARAAEHARISYVGDIAPLIAEKCAGCHQPNSIGPMELTSYEDVQGFAPMIRETLRTKRMPPFHADTEITAFHDDQSLSVEQTQMLVHWIEAGAPRGVGADPLAGREWGAPDWPLGEPDLVLDVPAYTIPATGIVQYQRPFTPYPATEGRWLRAATFKVDQRQAVHHILTGYIAEPPQGRAQASESLWGASLGVYAVGTEWAQAPDNVGTYLPPGGAIGFQNHYTPFGREVTDNTQIGLYFYDEAPDMILRSNTILDPTIVIPPGEERHQETAYLTFPKDAVLYGAFIHAHYRGAGSKLEIQYPDGRREMLIAVPRYDFNWQRDYRFAEPVNVPAGAKLIATYTYDNSARNPANPDPTRAVPWGEQSFDEMLYTTLSYRWVDETSDAPTDFDDQLMASRTIGMFDDNIDDRVELAELKGRTGERLRTAFPMLDRDGDGALDSTEISAASGTLGGGG